MAKLAKVQRRKGNTPGSVEPVTVFEAAQQLAF